MKVTVTVDPPIGRIGDTIRVTAALEATADPWTAEPSEALRPGERLGPFHIVDVDLSRAGTIVLGLTPEEAGTLEVPGFEAVFRLPGKDDLRLAVPPAKVEIASLLGEGDATLSDIKPPADLPVPWPWREIGLGVLGAVLAAALVLGVRRWLRKRARSRVRPEEELPPGVTADAWARAELEALLGKNLRESGHDREFHIELADLARRYLELRFRVPALERTTEEVGDEMRRALLAEEATLLTTQLLARCDRVKFAKHRAPRSESDETVSLTRALIERTASVPAAALAEPRPIAEGTAA